MPYRPPEPFTLHNVRRCGFAIIGVPDGALTLTYSVGLCQTYRAPEVLILGLATPIAGQLIHIYGQRIKAGERFASMAAHGGFCEAYEVFLVPLLQKPHKRLMGEAICFYHGVRFDAVQMVIPDKAGLWPWDADCDEEIHHKQCLSCRAGIEKHRDHTATDDEIV